MSGSLDRLVAFDLLEIGPVKVEPGRIRCPYRLSANGVDDTMDLVYKYEEPVFDPASPADRNLAAMITAQVAFNYGLFCRTIRFCGEYDAVDQRFIREMTENTSREIYVKKLLEPNPFLTGDARKIPAEKQTAYTRAVLEFSGDTKPMDRQPWRIWPVNRRKHAILSSGGKDSLLSFGVIRESGAEVFPLFVNESGRHWYTALNAYRYFREQVPGTGRVWVNSDRIFTWMLRHMPFIRKDFASLRADDYPIRLWTVAVFLFGVLPLMKKHGMGRLIIGDEYDTTRRLNHRGIPHYDGLYDQSRYFDHAMSRYFMRKGWSVSQFSVLRPLSELLIEKILAERYPDLLEHQVSCHAAHPDGDRIRPCGKCEKCRRIVGMLTAYGADPAICGYTHDQIRACLKEVFRSGVHQESAGAEHMKYLLKARGLPDPETAQTTRATPHPEVLLLRFDSERAPIAGIPVDLRDPLYRIYLHHAGGAVARVQRRWEPLDIPAHPDMRRAYPFETESPGPGNGAFLPMEIKRTFVWGELTWPEVRERLERVDIALLPVGSIEQHGPHLPVDTDAFDAGHLAMRVAEACSDPKPFVLPLIPYGVSYEHDDFAGTISVNNQTLANMVYEIGMSIARQGIKKLVIINGHGGNTPAIQFAAQMINKDARIFVAVDTGETSDVDIYRIAETPSDIHAGEIETSTSLAVRPELVDMSRAERLTPDFSSQYLNFTSKRGVSWFSYTQRFSPSGIIGDPTRASAEKGTRIWDIMTAHLVSFIEDLKDLTLEEIFQRRY